MPRAFGPKRAAGLLLLATAALVVSAAVLLYQSAQAKRLANEFAWTSSRLRIAQGHTADLFKEFEGSITRIIATPRRKTTLTADQVAHLNVAHQFFERYVEGNRDDPRLQTSLASAHRQLGVIHLLLRDFVESERAFRASQRLCEAQQQGPSRSPRRTICALNNSSLCWLLATTGRFDEAEQAVTTAVQHLQQLVAERPEDSALLVELTVALRNQGIIRAVLGSDGVEELSHSLSVARRANEGGHVKYYGAIDLVIDSLQVLGEFLWRQSRFAEAEDVCLQSIESLEDVLAEIERRFVEGESSPSAAPFRETLILARRNLELLRPQPNRGQDRASLLCARSALSGCWMSRLLRSVPGLTLSTDLLVEGVLPAEFEKQDALLLSWTNNEWCREEFTRIVSAVHESLPVILLVADRLMEKEAASVLQEAGVSLARVEFLIVPTDTVWVRDYGPLAVRSRAGASFWVDAAYTNVYTRQHFEDDDAPQEIARLLGMQVVQSSVLFEGGGILSNGVGLCVVSSDLLARNAALGIGESHVTNTIRRLFGATQVVYLEPLVGEETGHVDFLAVFTSPDTIVVGEYTSDDPVNQRLLNQSAATLANLVTAKGPLNVVRIPMPSRGREYFGGTYTNAVFANRVLLVPTWPEASAELEARAFETYRRLLPHWKIVGINAKKLGLRDGALRCATMNLRLLNDDAAESVGGGS